VGQQPVRQRGTETDADAGVLADSGTPAAVIGQSLGGANASSPAGVSPQAGGPSIGLHETAGEPARQPSAAAQQAAIGMAEAWQQYSAYPKMASRPLRVRMSA